MTGLPVALNPLRDFLVKHHPVLFISLITLLLALAVYVLYSASTATEESGNAISSIGQFDKATVDKIKSLHDSTDSSETLTFPKPRSNPFSE